MLLLKPEAGPDYKEELEVAVEGVNTALVDVVRIVEAGFGSFMEVAYEFTFEEGMDILEILDIREGLEAKEAIIKSAKEASLK